MTTPLLQIVSMVRLQVIVFIMITCSSVLGQILFSEQTFERFVYHHAQTDTVATRLLRISIREQFPEATGIHCLSLVSSDQLMKILSHYAILTGRRYEMISGRFVFPFKKRRSEVADRIEIFSQMIPRMPEQYWPTRIQLVLIDFPLSPPSSAMSASTQSLRELAGRLLYEGELREDIAAIMMEELGESAQVLVVDTRNSFEQVYRFFTRTYGRIRIIPAFSGDVIERDFEIDATSASALDVSKLELHIRVLENPLITDREGNSFRYIGHVFIQYTFWFNQESTPGR